MQLLQFVEYRYSLINIIKKDESPRMKSNNIKSPFVYNESQNFYLDFDNFQIRVPVKKS